MGHVAVEYGFTNGSPQICSLTGYPQIQLLDAARKPMAVQVRQATDAYTFSDQQPRRVAVAPGASAYFHLEWIDVAPFEESCASASYLRVTPPGGATAFDVAEAVKLCDAKVTTSPVEPTSS
jgi:hypothetical protein